MRNADITIGSMLEVQQLKSQKAPSKADACLNVNREVTSTAQIYRMSRAEQGGVFICTNRGNGAAGLFKIVREKHNAIA